MALAWPGTGAAEPTGPARDDPSWASVNSWGARGPLVDDPTVASIATDARRAPRHGYPVLDGSGAEIGEVTSGAPSPTLGHPIAMAYVDRAHSAPGTELKVDIRGRSIDVRVVELPFYRRPA